VATNHPLSLKKTKMYNESQAETTNILIVNAIRLLDEQHKYLLIEKITQNISSDMKTKLRKLFNQNPY
jgi:hypothetical protein